MLDLRDFDQGDIVSLVEMLNNKRVTKYLSSQISDPYSIEDAKWWINTGSKVGIVKAIEVDGILVGCINAIAGEFENSRSAEIGYWIGEGYWGKGIATNSINQLTNFVFSNTNIVRLFAPVFSPNKTSMHVLKKCGYIEEAILKKSFYKNGQYYDEHVFAKIRS